MIINDQSIYDYMSCPIRYDIGHNNKVDVRRNITIARLLEPIAKYTFTKLSQGSLVSVEDLKRRWNKICENNLDYVNDKRCIQGLSYIIDFHNWIKREQIILCPSNSYYEVQIGNNVVTGNIENISLTKKGPEILFVSFSEKVPSQFEIDNKLEYKLNLLAYNKSFDNKALGARIHYVKHDIDMFTTIDDSTERISKIIDNVAKGIKNEIYFPKESFMCSSCTVKGLCNTWGSKELLI